MPVGADHGHVVHHHGHSILHRAPAHAKILATVAFVLAVVATPAGVFWPYAAYLAVLLVTLAISQVPAAYLLKRMIVEVPVLVFAAWLPFVATGERVTVAGWSVSSAGLIASAGLVAKATLGVLAALLLGATTEVRDLLEGLRRLRVPSPLVEIMGFMARYVQVVSADLGRMRIALLSRGFDPRSPAHWPIVARSLGALFVRSYERGERVHVAMMSRGYHSAFGTPEGPAR